MENDGRWFSTEEAAEHALAWCARHSNWKRYCDCSDDLTNRLVYEWHELPEVDRKPLQDRYGVAAKTLWDDAANKPYRHRYGFISGEGRFYADVRDIPFGHNLMTVIQAGGKPGFYYRGGMGVRSGQRRFAASNVERLSMALEL